MNVKSKFDTVDVEAKKRNQYMRGGCGTPYSMISGPTRVDVSNIKAPKIIKWLFEVMGWKIQPDGHPKN